MSKYRFPSSVKLVTELEPAVQQALADQLPIQTTFKSLLVIPPDVHPGPPPGRRFRSRPGRVPEWTLALTDDRLFAVVRDTVTAYVEITVIPLASMIAFEWGEILLYSWIDIIWADSGLHHTRIEFNTVGKNFLQALLAALRQAVLARLPLIVDPRTELTEGQIWTLPMKFANMLLLYALLPDEQVYTYCFEPTIKPRWFWGRRRASLLWAVTNQHCLFIQEPLESYPYGVIFTFCPRGEIRDARVVATEQECELRLTLGDPSFEVKGVFSPARQVELTASLELLSGQQVAVQIGR
jgi:hypothetical protein